MKKIINIFLFVICCSFFSNLYSQSEYRFGLNRSLKLQNTTYHEVYSIYTFHIRVSESYPITVIHMPKNSIEYERFVEHFILMNLRSYSNLITSRSSTGMGIYIQYANSKWDMVEKIKSTPFSIGYVDNFIYINEGDSNDIKIINIDVYTGNS